MSNRADDRDCADDAVTGKRSLFCALQEAFYSADTSGGMPMTAGHGIARLGLAGSAAGTMNAWLCYANWPVPVQNPYVSFEWHVVPAGVVHGGLLAIAAMCGALLAARRRPFWRYALVPVAGWIGGYVSWIPLQMSVFGDSFIQALVWPIANGDSALQGVWLPFLYFGLVSTLYYMWLIMKRASSRIWTEAVAASCAGVLGSSFWWSAWGPWYFSPLHGVVWGCLVGSAVSATRCGGDEAAE